MAYIGRGLVQGTYIKLDDIQGSFNGTTSTFNLTSGGSAFKPGSASALLVSLGGVIQEPIESYTVIDDQITFSSPPTSDANIFLIALGSAVSIGTPADNTIDATKLRDPFGTYTGTGGFTLTGIVSATEFRGSGKYLTELSAGKFISDSIGITTNTPAGINTSTLDDPDLVGLGNSFQGMYISNGMLIHDNELTGAHYIGTNFRGLMAGPVTIGGTLTVDGNYVVV